jgi:hypothetical protein
MFGFLKKRVNSEMKNLVALATFVSCFKMYRGFLMFVEHQKESTLPIPKNNWLNKIDTENKNDICMQLAAASANYLFNQPFHPMHLETFTKEVIEEEAMMWLSANERGDKNFCKLVVQSLRVLNTLEFMNNKNLHTTIIGEAILLEYGHNYKEEPNPKNYKELISDLASFYLEKEDLDGIIGFAKEHNISLTLKKYR